MKSNASSKSLLSDSADQTQSSINLNSSETTNSTNSQPQGIPILPLKAVNTTYSNTTIQSMISTFNSLNDQQQKKISDLEAIIKTYQDHELLYKQKV